MLRNSDRSLPLLFLITSDPSKTSFFKRTLKHTHHILDAPDLSSARERLSTLFADFIVFDDVFSTSSPELLFHALKTLRADTSSPILLISKNLKTAFIKEALKAGANDFLQEPLDPLELNQRLAVLEKAKETSKKMAAMPSKIGPSSLEEGKRTLEERLLLQEPLLKEIDSARKNNTPLNLLLIEIDDFKKIFKAREEKDAKEVQDSLVSLLKTCLRPLDRLFPQSGGKFLVLLPKTSPRAATLIAETMRKEALLLNLTLSIGIVSFEEKRSQSTSVNQDFEEVFARAAEALERAKKKGNQIIFDG